MLLSRINKTFQLNALLEDAHIKIHTANGCIAFIKGNRDGLLNGESSNNERENGEVHTICMTRRKLEKNTQKVDFYLNLPLADLLYTKTGHVYSGMKHPAVALNNSIIDVRKPQRHL